MLDEQAQCVYVSDVSMHGYVRVSVCMYVCMYVCSCKYVSRKHANIITDLHVRMCKYIYT